MLCSQFKILIYLYSLGDVFSTGDVLLEIETDKAQMDVEAQDDGLVAKIFVCGLLLKNNMTHLY